MVNLAGLLRTGVSSNRTHPVASFETWRQGLIAYGKAEEKANQKCRDEAGHESPTLKNTLGKSRYNYRPLDVEKREIRILFVEPSDSLEEPIKARIVVSSLDECRIHDCLSYVWGRPGAEALIYVDGRPLEISANLQRALQRYRAKENCSGILWVDVVCINQEDHQEKNLQVRMMRHIYEQALTVFAYIGEPRLDGAPFECLSLLNPEFGSHHYLDIRGFTALCQGQGYTELDVTKAIHEVLCRPWFRRAWIIQEGSHNMNVMLAFARALIKMDKIFATWCVSGAGRSSVAYARHMKALQRCIEEAPDKRSLIKDDGRLLRLIHREATENGTVVLATADLRDQLREREARVGLAPYRLLDMLSDFRFTGATDPRDKIYALLGLATDVKGSPDIDYTLQVEDVYSGFSRFFIHRGDGLEILQAAAVNPRSETLSWVPTWIEGTPRRESFHDFLCKYAGYRAGGDMRPLVYTNDDDRGSCRFRGRIIDHIAFLGHFQAIESWQELNTAWSGVLLRFALPAINATIKQAGKLFRLPLRDWDGSVVWLDWLKALANDTLHDQLWQFDESERKEVFTRAMGMASYIFSYKYSSMYTDEYASIEQEASTAARRRQAGISSLNDPFEIMFRELFDPDRFGKSGFGGAEDRKRIPFRHTLQKLLYGRRFCITTEGYVGVVPHEVDVGDAIAMAAGAPMLFVLKHCKDAREGYLLRGEAYLRGYMYGKAGDEGELEEITLV